MTDSTRRRFLTGLSTAAAVGLAGCSALPFGGDNSDTNSDDTPSNLEDQLGESTPNEDAPDIDYPANGYINTTSGEIRQGELEDAEPVEYLLAAREAYQMMGENLTRSYNYYEDMVERLNRENPLFEEADKDRRRAAYWSQWASFMCSQTITLLKEIDEREALSRVSDTKTLIEEEYRPFVKERTAEFVDKYESGDMGYVGENATDIYETFEDIKGRTYWWTNVVAVIDTTKYPGYGDEPWGDTNSSNSSN